MKSLKERQKEKAIRLAKEEKKLSTSKVYSYRVSLPCVGSPHMTKDSDFKYVREKAKMLVNTIRARSCYQLYEALKNAIEEKEKEMEEMRIARAEVWGVPVATGQRQIIPSVSLPALPPPSPTPFDELPVPTSGEAIGHILDNTITDIGQLAPGQLDAIVQQAYLQSVTTEQLYESY